MQIFLLGGGRSHDKKDAKRHASIEAIPLLRQFEANV
jgi:hypothetical protein